MFRRPTFLLLALPALGLAFPSALEAQVDESLLTRRWKSNDFWAETYDKLFLTSQGRLEDTDERIQFFHWDSEGRIKFDAKDLEPPVWVGYRAYTISVNSDAEALHHSFADVALAVALDLGWLPDQWSVHAAAGVGTANDGRWDNLHALYPTATLDFSHDINLGTLHVGVGLDGNRNLVPRIPLPYLQIETQLEDELDVLWGFPKTEFVFRPFHPILLSLQWAFPSNASARLEGDVGAGLSLFAEVGRHIDAFHLRHEDRLRQFFLTNSVEVGIRWATKLLDVSLSVGYAFGQRIFTGDDLARRNQSSSVENLPFIGLTFPSTFWAAPFSSGLEPR